MIEVVPQSYQCSCSGFGSIQTYSRGFREIFRYVDVML